ncbi:MAG: hypothetical protein SO013_05225 [Prevotella sp.]|nr:hypothetical protein [Prevotella sp.]
MKKTTLFTIIFFACSLLFYFGIQLVSFASLSNANDDIIRLDKLTEHPGRPIKTIVAGKDSAALAESGFRIWLYLSFVESEEECSMAYLEDLMEVEQKDGIFTFSLKDDFRRRLTENYSFRCSDGVKEWDTYHSDEHSQHYVVIKKDGSTERYICEDGSTENYIPVHIKTMRGIETVSLNNRCCFVTSGMQEKRFRIEDAEFALFRDKSLIDELMCETNETVKLKDTQIKEMYLKGVKRKSGFMHYVHLLADDNSKVGRLTLNGSGTANIHNGASFGEIVSDPDKGKILNIAVNGISKRRVLQ